MRLVICGTRYVFDPYAIDWAIRSLGLEGRIDSLVIGGTRGMDAAAEVWARTRLVTFERIVGQWRKYGRRAREVRSQEMVKDGDAVLAFWDGEERDECWLCVEAAEQLGKPCWVVLYEGGRKVTHKTDPMRRTKVPR